MINKAARLLTDTLSLTEAINGTIVLAGIGGYVLLTSQSNAPPLLARMLVTVFSRCF